MAAISSNIPIGITNDADRLVTWAPLVKLDPSGAALDCSGYRYVTIGVYGAFDGCATALQCSMGDFTLAPGDQAYSDTPYYDAGVGATTKEPIGVFATIAGYPAPPSNTPNSERVWRMPIGARYIRPVILGSPIPSTNVFLIWTAILHH
jgi:hypothetical protein